jgi:hypothetical protein
VYLELDEQNKCVFLIGGDFPLAICGNSFDFSHLGENNWYHKLETSTDAKHSVMYRIRSQKRIV